MRSSILSAAMVMALSASRALDQSHRFILPQIPSSFQGEITLAQHAPGMRGAGISMATQKRASIKAKNRARNKKHHRKS